MRSSILLFALISALTLPTLAAECPVVDRLGDRIVQPEGDEINSVCLPPVRQPAGMDFHRRMLIKER